MLMVALTGASILIAFFEIVGILALLSFAIRAAAFVFDFLTKPVPRCYPAPTRPRIPPRSRLVSFETRPD